MKIKAIIERFEDRRTGKREGNYKANGPMSARKSGIYGTDQCGQFIHLTFFDVRRFLPEFEVNDFNELRANPEALKTLEDRYGRYIERGGLLQSTESAKAFHRCHSDVVIYDILGQWPVTEWDLFNRQVEDAA